MDDKLSAVQQEAVTHLNKTFKETSHFFNLKYKILIYNLLKNGHVRIVDLVADTGLTKERLYKIVDDIEKFLKEEIKKS